MYQAQHKPHAVLQSQIQIILSSKAKSLALF